MPEPRQQDNDQQEERQPDPQERVSKATKDKRSKPIKSRGRLRIKRKNANRALGFRPKRFRRGDGSPFNFILQGAGTSSSTTVVQANGSRSN